MLNYNPVSLTRSYCAKLSVLWVKKLLSEVDRHLYLLTPIPNQPWEEGEGDVGENEGPPCPLVISQGYWSPHVSLSRLFKFESVQPNPTLLKGKKNKGVGGWFFSKPLSPSSPLLLTLDSFMAFYGLSVKPKAILCFTRVLLFFR